MSIERAPATAAARQSTNSPERTRTRDANAILVLGMHRSGTSAVARVIGLMGADIGTADELLPAHPTDNPTGYWERAELNAIHDRMLEAVGHRWDRLAGFDPRQLETETLEPAGAALQALIDRLQAAGKPWVAKDPRLCLLLSPWRARVAAACVVVVRDPREIAASMGAGPRGVFTSPFVVALWEKYLRTLLADLDGASALFVDYAALLADPHAQSRRLLRGLQALGIEGLQPPEPQALDAFLSHDLRRSAPRAHVTLSPDQERLYSWLRTQCDARSAVPVHDYPQAPAPDALLAEFEAAFAFHREHGRAEAAADTRERLAAIEARLARQDEERAVWLAELAARREEVARLQAEVATRREEAARLQAEVATRREEAARLQAEVNAQRAEAESQRDRAERALADNVTLTARMQAGERERAALAAEQEGLAQENTRLGGEVAESRRHAAALEDSVRALRASWSWRLTAPLRGIGRWLRWRPRFAAEQRLHRWYYAAPGVNAARKRALILWLHEHAPWLTRHTLSYRLYRQSRDLEAERARTHEERERRQRMDERRAATLVATLPRPPTISIVMPVYNVERRWLMEAVDSVRRQFYPHWELCIADDASTRADTRAALDEIERWGDARIKLRRLPQNRGIAGASNAALELATGEFVGLLDHDDELSRDALLEMALRIATDDPDVLYSDEDKLDADGRHREPHFKPDFNLEYFFSVNYICHFTVLRRALLERIGGFRPGFDGAQDYDLLLRAIEQTERVAHIPKVLYHWRQTESSTATISAAKPHAWDAGLRALGESLARRGIDAVAERGPYPTTYRVRRAIRGQPLVSILIPFRDKPELLAACVGSILERSDYPHFEILGIDNGSREPATQRLLAELVRRDARVRFERYDAPFNFSAVNNFGARKARGEHLLFLNNDTEVISAEWLRALLEHSQRPEIGVVGAKLLYGDGTIQHAGVIVGIGGVAGHAHLFHPGDHPGYFARAQLPQRLSAVTFACAMTRREVFEQLGGLNERELAVAFNDIDYCLRAVEAGFEVIYTPFAALYHHESRSRGYEDNPEKQARFAREVAYMRERHRVILERGDPHYNPNLRLDCNDFTPQPGYADALPL